MHRHAVTWSEAILAGSLAFFAYALVSTRRWVDREHQELRQSWTLPVPAAGRHGGNQRG
jgi:hypothetical protein